MLVEVSILIYNLFTYGDKRRGRGEQDYKPPYVFNIKYWLYPFFVVEITFLSPTLIVFR